MPNTITAADRDKLRAIKSFPQLVKYLRDELHWPIDSDDFDDISFDYTPEELGIDAKTAAKIQEIKQLRPLAGGQPWGIFFVKFEPKQLPIVVLRKILARLVVKKRASANAPDKAAWQMHDLLFVSNYGDADERQITFAHFIDQNEAGDLPTLKVLGWDEDDTALHLDQVATELKQNLVWKDGENVNDWRMRWSSAFKLRPREVITTSKQLAVKLAQLARDIRRRANSAMKFESDTGPLKSLMAGFKSALIHDLDEDRFADMYAQTIAYGLLSARVSRPNALVADNLADMVPVTNPFLKELMQTFLNVGGRRWNDDKGKLVGIDFDELGINDVVDLLREANMEAVLADFGNRNPTEDPVIHFYELFLKEYDAKLRMQRGVFYTPRPVVSYIVRSVHELLQTEFGLADGLADTATWAEMLKRFPASSPSPGTPGEGQGEDLRLPTIDVVDPISRQTNKQPIDPATPFVQILDPATGTATFLVEVIDVIFNHLRAKWLKQGHMELQIPDLWNDYVPKHLLPRLHGYELMMAPYAIAHMKTGLKLFETGYKFGSGERARIYLTNALEPPQDFSDTFEQMAPALAHEAKAVNDVKRHQRFTVVIGNPPYSNFGKLNRISWILDLLDDYKRGLNERKLNLDDDFIKFIRFAQHLCDAANCGIVGMITNSTYVDGLTHRRMRASIVESFPVARVLDLHGSVVKGDRSPDGSADDNVFEIQQGVAISLLIKPPHRVVGQLPTVTTADLWGVRERKYAVLSAQSVNSQPESASQVSPKTPAFSFRSVSEEGAEYDTFVSLRLLMPVGTSAVQTKRDALFVDFDRDVLATRMHKAIGRPVKESLAAGLPVKSSSGWSPTALEHSKYTSDKIRRYLYRPFDMRHIYYDDDLLGRSRHAVFKHMLQPNLAIATLRQTVDDAFRHVFVTRDLCDLNLTIGHHVSDQVFPLFRYEDSLHRKSDAHVELNLNFDLARALMPQRDAQSQSDLRQWGESVLSYVYAILHSPGFRHRYCERLKKDFPHIPCCSNEPLSASLCELGAQLISLHLLESKTLNRHGTDFTISSNDAIEKVTYANSTVWLDKKRTCGFAGVPEAVWNFHIGGYQVCEKWLKDRKGRTLSKDDIAHYQKIVVAISETIRLMKEIDETIEKHGGWPGAFVTDPKVLEDLKAKKA